MGQILDIVPNHMSAAPGENAWWTDVLENGPGSPYAAYFDIDWHPVKEELREQAPPAAPGRAVRRGAGGGPTASWSTATGLSSSATSSRSLPLDPRTLRTVLRHRLDELKAALPAESRGTPRAGEHHHGPGPPARRATETEPERVAERQREKEVIKDRLQRLTARNARRSPSSSSGTFAISTARRATRRASTAWTDCSTPRSTGWRIGRRPATRSTTAASSTSTSWRPFAWRSRRSSRSHRLVFELLVRGDVAGLRIDHIDGLFDPMEYLRRLQWGYAAGAGPGQIYAQRAVATRDWPRRSRPHWRPRKLVRRPCRAGSELSRWSSARCDAAPDVRRPSGALPLYVVVEKILGPEEPLPREWPVAGTTGYDFLTFGQRLFVDRAGLAEADQDLRPLHRRADRLPRGGLRSEAADPAAAMSSELQLLAQRLNRISERHRRSRDFTLNTLRVGAARDPRLFPVYRTYIREGCVSDRDRQFVLRAVAQAKRRNPAVDAAVFDFVRDVLLLEAAARAGRGGPPRARLVRRPLPAGHQPGDGQGRGGHGLLPLLSAGVAQRSGRRSRPRAPSAWRNSTARTWPGGRAGPARCLATTTHDTKRSEDVRRGSTCSRRSRALWRKAVNRWARLNRRHRREVDGQPAPSRNDEYLLLSNAAGHLAAGAARRPAPGRARRAGCRRYMEKATHEAKVHTSWINPNAEYDAAVREFVAARAGRSAQEPLPGRVPPFHERIVDWGLYSALSQGCLKLTSPGVPDIYQGQELWDFSLVDPDNRRPVDFALRGELLAELQAESSADERIAARIGPQLNRQSADPRLKMLVTWRMLQFRRRHADFFRGDEYHAVELPKGAGGPRCAYGWRRTPSAGKPEQVASCGSSPAGGAAGHAMGRGGRAVAGAAGRGRLERYPLEPCPPGRAADRRTFLPAKRVCPEGDGMRLSSLLADFPVALLSKLDL